LLPDLTVLLDLSAERSAARLAGTELDRLESEKAEFFETVRQGFLTLAAKEPKRWLVLDADRPVNELATEIRHRVTTLFAK
jgi:dTMP kinase